MSARDSDRRSDAPNAAENEKDGRPDEDSAASGDEHLADIPDGCGCAEIWEHLSDRRE